MAADGGTKKNGNKRGAIIISDDNTQAKDGGDAAINKVSCWTQKTKN